MTSTDVRPLGAAPYGLAAQMTESFTKLTFDWWRAQPARLLDESAPWNFGLYMTRRLIDLMARPVAVTEEERAYRVEAEVPGITPRDLDVRVADGMLRISANEDGGEVAALGHAAGPGFAREIPLPANVDAEKATAEVHDGRLTVTVPKQPRARDHKVAVKAA